MLARTLFLLAVFFSSFSVEAQDPGHEVIVGNASYFDFGPPFSFYNVYVLRPDGQNTSIDLLSLTPPANQCNAQTTFEHSQVVAHKTLASLLEHDPCTITDKQILKESKRKRGLQFSGAVLSMRLSCSGKERIIPMQFLEEDLFSDRPNPPKGVSWAMSLMERLANEFKSHPSNSTEQTDVTHALAEGAYDNLYARPPHVLSRLYAESQVPVRSSEVTLVSSTVQPGVHVLPGYPPIAQAAHVEGDIELRGVIGEDGRLTSSSRTSGPELFEVSSKAALQKWIFKAEDAKKTVDVTLHFALNCSTVQRAPDLPR